MPPGEPLIAGAWLCLLAPLVGALQITVLGRSISRRTAAWLSTVSVFVAFGGAVASLVGLLGRDHEEREVVTTAWTWLATPNFDVGLSLLVDPLSVTMMLIVSGVGGLIVLYSIGYMDGDPEERRYFAYMSLFVFSMLLLVQAGNFLLLLAGWGLVGLASYLLIGFWHERPEAVAAAKKAFVMNAFGDATMALAFFVLIWQTGTLNFDGAFAGAEGMSQTLVNLVALGLLGGAVAKSAQIPLHTWLPDAMEGPTPVSALIHAATMVTAGVYLIVRAHPDLRAGAVDLRSRRRPWRDHASRRRLRRPRADRHQARDRLLDDVADRLHVPRRRPRRVRERDVPPDDARVLQGAALPGRRARDPSPRERAGHPEDGRPPESDAEDIHRLPGRLARARRHSAALGLLLEGLDPRLGTRPRAAMGNCSSPPAS